MRTSYFITFLAVAVTALVGCNHMVGQLPANQPIISVEQRSRMFRVISLRSGQSVTPGVDIFADGRCMVRTPGGEEFEKRLRSSELRGLLGFFKREGLFAISNESIERAIDRELQQKLVPFELPDGSVVLMTRSRVCVVDGSDTRIAARTRTRRVEISRYALDSELEEYRTVTELRTIRRCIERVHKVAGL